MTPVGNFEEYGMRCLLQDEYADNFKPNSFNALAIYDPSKCSARVGDIGFFMQDASFCRILNAFDDVRIKPPVFIHTKSNRTC